MKTRTLHHICIQTNNYEKSLSFYTKILGFELIKETKDFHGRYFNTWLRLNSFMIEMQTAKAGEQLKEFNSLSEGIVHLCFFVDDIQYEYQRLKQLGYLNFLSKDGEDIYKVEGGHLFKIVAPEGTIIEVRDNEGI